MDQGVGPAVSVGRGPLNVQPHALRVRSMLMRRFALLCALLLAAAVSLTACAEEKVSLARGPREYTASDYSEILDRWTRTESLITLAELDDKLTVTATFESWEFRWAYVVRYAQDYRLPVEQRRELLDKTLKE